MKLPAVAIAAAFASGIACGFTSAIARHANSRAEVALFLILSAAFLLAGVFLNRGGGHPSATAATSLCCWVLLGVAAACIQEQPRDAHHILSLADAGTINLKSPLRFDGRLRDEPETLPWGFGYQIDLTDVEYEGVSLRTSGGLQLSYARPAGEKPFQTLHAGDAISFLTQARLPRVFRDEGAFDRRAYLSQQGVDLVATLRTGELLELVEPARPSVSGWIARARRHLREEIDVRWHDQTDVAGILRAMLLGDRNFVDRDEATDFQKTGAFHVLAVAGLHVGAMAVILFWIGSKLRWPRLWTTIFTLLLLFAYVAVVDQRAPVLRAALMAAMVLLGGFFFVRLDLLNSAAIAALLLLVARPSALRDSSFQLSFLAIGCIGALALPWLERTAQPYARGLRGWRDVTRDVSHVPRAIQFRIDLRSLAKAMGSVVPARLSRVPGNLTASGLAFLLRAWELLVLTLVLQLGMLPLMASEFHRITFAAPIVNLAAVPLTGIIVPLGFLTMISGLIFPTLTTALAAPLSWATLALLHVVQRFAHVNSFSYRIPGPPMWITLSFLVALVCAMVCLRADFSPRRVVTRCLYGILAMLTLVIAVSPFPPRRAAGQLEVTVLDVGQGDSLLVVSPLGRTLLIDGGGAFGGFPGHEQARGPDPGEEAVSPYLWSRNFKQIDIVALTHAHQDHLGGLIAILDNFRVGQLWIGREVKSPAMARLEALAREKRIPVEYESRGKSFFMDGVEGHFLWPDPSNADSAAAAKNNDSLVLHLKYRDRTLLLPGDAEKQAERAMIAENPESDLQADVLKVGHHGSKNSTTDEFLHIVHPSLAIISAGEDNPYGHPSRELIQRLDAAGTRILRTDQDGAVHIITDGEKLQVTCFIPCAERTTSTASGGTEPPDQTQHNQ
jgi:competence protein ComEC